MAHTTVCGYSYAIGILINSRELILGNQQNKNKNFTCSCGLNDDVQTTKPRIARLNIGHLICGIVMLSMKQLITHRGPRTLFFEK